MKLLQVFFLLFKAVAGIVFVKDISSGFPGEIETRRKQYGYYRDKLLDFKEF